MTAHDGFTLRDLVSYERKHNEANGEQNRDGSNANRSWNHGVEGDSDDPAVLAARQRSLRGLLGTLLLSTGVPMLVAGDEMGRTQRGNNNAYCLDDATSWVDWELAPWQQDLLAWTRALVRLRRDHPVFRHRHFLDGRRTRPDGPKDLAWFRVDGQELTDTEWWSPTLQTLGMYLAGDGLRTRTRTGEPIVDHSFLLLLNAADAPVEQVLPGQPWAQAWQHVLDSSASQPPAGPLDLGTPVTGDTFTLAPRSLVLLRATAPTQPAS